MQYRVYCDLKIDRPWVLAIIRWCVYISHTICSRVCCVLKCHGPLARYVNLRVEHAPGMPGTFAPPPLVSDPDMHHGTCVTHVPWCMSWSLISGFLWSRWRGKRSRRMRNTQFCVSGKRPIIIDEGGNLNAIVILFLSSPYFRHRQ